MASWTLMSVHQLPVIVQFRSEQQNVDMSLFSLSLLNRAEEHCGIAAETTG